MIVNRAHVGDDKAGTFESGITKRLEYVATVPNKDRKPLDECIQVLVPGPDKRMRQLGGRLALGEAEGAIQNTRLFGGRAVIRQIESNNETK